MPITVKCLNCGKEFKVKPSLAKVRKFCSKECYAKWLGGRKTLTCLNCGKEFEVWSSLSERIKFCSRECYEKYFGHGNEIKKICLNCGKEFQVIPSKADHKFCSKRCYWEYKAKKNDAIKVDERFYEFVDGLLLGDGSIIGSKNSRHNCALSITQTVRHSDFIEFSAEILERYNIKFRIDTSEKRKIKIRGKVATQNEALWLRTVRCRVFTEERRRWYPNGVKRIPKDVRISPFSVALWYMGDGSCAEDKRSGNYILTFCTECFNSDNVAFLAKKLKEAFRLTYVGISNEKFGPRIRIQRKADVIRLLTQIEPYILESFRYKLKPIL